MKKKVLNLLLLNSVLIIIIAIPCFGISTTTSSDQNAAFENTKALRTYDKKKTIEGFTIFDLIQVNGTNLYNIIDRGALIVDMDGKIRDVLRNIWGGGDIEFINSTTIMYARRDLGVVFQNILTNKTEIIPIENSGHHDIEYNPFTDTFLILDRAIYGEYYGSPIEYDELFIVDRQNNILWLWNESMHIPFNGSRYNGDLTAQSYIDWSHGNSIFWDIELNVTYFNPRNLDTFYAIDMQTGDILWSVGRYGTLTCYDKYGNQKESLFRYAHSVKKMKTNHFLLFDNDLDNFTRLDPDLGESRLVEIEIDLESGTATEVWSWNPGSSYYSGLWGDVDRLPNGNTLGYFGWGVGDTQYGTDHPLYLTEVTQEGEIVWELSFTRTDEYGWRGYTAERYYSAPLIHLANPSLIEEENGSLILELSTWDSVNLKYHKNASIEVLNGTSVIGRKNFRYKPFWQETKISIPIKASLYEFYSFDIVIENEDGIIVTMNISNETSTVNNSGGFLTIINLLFISMIILFRRKKKLRYKKYI